MFQWERDSNGKYIEKECCEKIPDSIAHCTTANGLAEGMGSYVFATVLFSSMYDRALRHQNGVDSSTSGSLSHGGL